MVAIKINRNVVFMAGLPLSHNVVTSVDLLLARKHSFVKNE